MCGRFVQSSSMFEDVEKVAHIPEYVQEQLEFSTIYPSQKSLVLYGKDGALEGEALTFGFYSDYLKKRIINARAQGIESKWMFRKALYGNRVLIPCSGFFEWTPSKVKTYFYKENLPVLYMAGLAMDDGFVIITTEANYSVRDVHHRMPLIFPLEKAREWVFDNQQTKELLEYQPLLLNRESDQQTLF